MFIVRRKTGHEHTSPRGGRNETAVKEFQLRRRRRFRGERESGLLCGFFQSVYEISYNR